MTHKIVLISAPEVLEIPIKDNGEKLVDLSAFGFAIDKRKASASSSFYKVREAVELKLQEVQKKLPHGIKLLIIEGHRPLSLQAEYFQEYSETLTELHPKWDKQKVYQEASKYVAPPEIIPPHSTGGAIDLTLIDKTGQEIDMGTRVNANPEETYNAVYTFAENISELAKRNRNTLTNAMSGAGFVNYPTEWWHWSYGDRYWAFHNKLPHAIYSSAT